MAKGELLVHGELHVGRVLLPDHLVTVDAVAEVRDDQLRREVMTNILSFGHGQSTYKHRLFFIKKFHLFIRSENFFKMYTYIIQTEIKNILDNFLMY